ncbi:MAG: hypothetical protein CL797_08810 [Chromatiales bacterium]|nr:hypothetical protein [Chromatiales bacterium]
MRRVDLGVLAGCVSAIVARLTIIDDAGVIKHRRRKGTAGYVTDIAILVGHDMIGLGVLTGCIDTVMAGIAAGIQNFRAAVVDKRAGKTSRVVANGAISVRVLMNRRIGLP